MKTWEQYIRKVTPYTPGEQPKTANVVKLNTNEKQMLEHIIIEME